MATPLFEQFDQLGNKIDALKAGSSVQTREDITENTSGAYSDIRDDSGLEVSENIIKSGKRWFGDDRTPGVIIGIDPKDKKVKFEIGSSSTKMMSYNGVDFKLIGGSVISGTLRYGKTSFSDTANAGYIIDSNGLFIGNAGDTKSMKFTLSTGDLEIKSGTITGALIRSSATGARVELTSSGVMTVYNATTSIVTIDAGNANYYFQGYASGSVQAMRLFANNATTTANILEIDATDTTGSALYINGTSYSGTNILKVNNLASTTALFEGTSTSGGNIFRINQLDLDKNGLLITNSTSATAGNNAIVEIKEYSSGLPPLKLIGLSSTCLILDCDGNSISHLRFANLSGDPGSPVEGDIWYDSSSHTLKYRNNSATKTVATV